MSKRLHINLKNKQLQKDTFQKKCHVYLPLEQRLSGPSLQLLHDPSVCSHVILQLGGHGTEHFFP